MIRLGSLLAAILFTSGCAMVPYGEDTTSNFNKPSKRMAGIYVYKWKTGIFNALLDVGFEIKDEREIKLNTGEYGYFELEPGKH